MKAPRCTILVFTIIVHITFFMAFAVVGKEEEELRRQQHRQHEVPSPSSLEFSRAAAHTDRVPTTTAAAAATAASETGTTTTIPTTTTTHNCLHDTPQLRRLRYHSGMDLHVPQPGEHKNEKNNYSMHREHHLEKHTSKQRRSFKTTATTAFTGPIRITVSSLDLDDSSKYCATVGSTSPTFVTPTSTAICTEEDILTTAKKELLLNTILPLAIAKLNAALNVVQLTSNLVLTTAQCTGVTKATLDTSTGISSSDFNLYVTAGPTTNGTLAFAGYCALSGTNRPIAGTANFGPSYLLWNEDDAAANDEVVGTAVHELIHALGFSGSYIASYFPAGSITAASPTGATTANTTLRSKTVTLVTTDNVIIAARNFFNCGSLEGLELEDEGNTESVGSHWDRRVAPEEMMTSAGGTKLTSFTLAALEDSGHYGISSDLAREASSFGAQAGCSFVTSICNSVAGGKGKYWCFDTEAACTHDYQSIGRCNTQSHSSIPNHFQYFTDPTLGGDIYYDYCPIVQKAVDFKCTNANLTGTQDAALGHYFGDGGRCFATTGVLQDGGSSSSSAGDTGLRCYAAKCLNAQQVHIKIEGTATWLSCPSDGSAGTVAAPSGWTGTITCPAAADFCDTSINYGFIVATPNPATYTVVPAPTNATTTRSPETTTAAAAVTTTVPLTTSSSPTDTTTAVPTSATLVYQFASSLALAQYTTSIRVLAQSQIATAVGVTTSSVQMILIAAGEGTFEGATVLRFTVVTITPEETVKAALNEALFSTDPDDVSSSDLRTLTQPVPSSFEAVADCSSVCASGSGNTVTHERNIQNTACTCVCGNSWNGTLCDDCPSIYNASLDCGTCAGGFIGYPSCTTTGSCVAPLNRTLVDFSSTCDTRVQLELSSKNSACLEVACECQGGSFTTEFTCSVTDALSECQSFLCTGILRECLYQETQEIMTDFPQSCQNSDMVKHDEANSNARLWCTFDSCLNPTLASCPESTIITACSTVDYEILPSSGAARGGGGGQLARLLLVIATTLFTTFLSPQFKG